MTNDELAAILEQIQSAQALAKAQLDEIQSEQAVAKVALDEIQETQTANLKITEELRPRIFTLVSRLLNRR